MPFDRLIAAMDTWAAEQLGVIEVFAQVGCTKYKPRSMAFAESISPAEFADKVHGSSVMVAHAGMGSVLTALEVGRPLVIMPRRGDLLETRNDHQIATAKWLADRSGIYVAMSEGDLPQALSRAMLSGAENREISPNASPQLVGALRLFLTNDQDWASGHQNQF